MSLPADVARCKGLGQPVCSDCRRKEPGREQWQTYMQPHPIQVGETCPHYIPPAYRTTTKEVPR